MTFINGHGLSRGAARKLAQHLIPAATDSVSRTVAARLIRFVRASEPSLAEGERLPLSTEILESSFGLYKQLERQHSKSGFTSLIAAFASLLRDTTPDMIRPALTRVLNDYGQKYKFLKESEANLTGDDVREGLTAIVSVKLPNPQFEGQTKTKLGNTEIRAFVEKTVNDQLGTWLEEHPDDAKRIIQKSEAAQKARLAACAARQGCEDHGTKPPRQAAAGDG